MLKAGHNKTCKVTGTDMEGAWRTRKLWVTLPGSYRQISLGVMLKLSPPTTQGVFTDSHVCI